MSYILAVDTGGTFTDLVAYDLEKHELRCIKTLTNEVKMVNGVIDCIRAANLNLSEVAFIKHGTTQVINTYIQRSGAKTALITNRGYRDLLEIGRGNRPVPFKLTFRKDPPLVPRTLCFEIAGRIDGRGREITPLDTRGLQHLAEILKTQGVEAVAVSFINAYKNPAHEKLAVGLLRECLPDVYVTNSTDISSEWYEFERTSTAVANAYIGPKIKEYIGRLDKELKDSGFNGRIFMMASNGGVHSVERTLSQPVNMVESGPIGGCIGAAAYGRELGIKHLIAFDMGGTTAKCSLIQNGQFEICPIYYVDGYEKGFPLRISVLDVVEVGAGGGSIAWVDTQKRLHVGPHSSGAEPGPVAFGRGGTEPTVTDANLVLGRISSETFLNSALRLDENAAFRAIADRVCRPLGYSNDTKIVDTIAEGILAIVSARMAGAIKEITMERGLDTRDFELFVFGGSGPLFGSSLARELHIPVVIVPPEPGNFSAIGMLLADERIDSSQSLIQDLSEDSIAELDQMCKGIKEHTKIELLEKIDTEDVSFEQYIEICYRGQSRSMKIPFSKDKSPISIRKDFEDSYHQRYGHINKNNPVEIRGIRVSAHAETKRPEIMHLHKNSSNNQAPPVKTRSVYFAESGSRLSTPIFKRNTLPIGFKTRGPAIIEEYGSTTLIGPFDRFEICKAGEIRININVK